MSDIGNDNIFSHFKTFNLYHQEFEEFFLTRYIAKKIYAKNEIIDRMPPESRLVSYLHKGYLKLYTLNADGNEIFNGFIPEYSVIISTPGISLLGKYSVANTETEIFYASLSEYLTFLAQSPERILHQIYEPYYRRNFNDLPRYETINQSARLKTYVYLHYLASRFGEAKPNNPHTIVIDNPPSYKDIAHFNDIHPSNVVTFLNDLKRLDIIHRTKSNITILDRRLLEKEIETLKDH